MPPTPDACPLRSHVLTAALRLVFFLLPACLVPLSAAPTDDGLVVNRAEGKLEVFLPASLPTEGLSLRIHSDRNAPVPRFSDLSPLQPEAYLKRPSRDRDCWYPVIDLKVDDDMEAVIALAAIPANTRASWNGWVRRESQPAEEVLHFRAPLLLEWENTLWMDRGEPRVMGFHLRKPLSGREPHQPAAILHPLTADWSGRIEVVTRDAAGREVVLFSRSITSPPQPTSPARPTGEGLSPARLVEAAAGAVLHTLRSQVNDPNDPMQGGLYVFYDLDARTYRSSHWAWAWGPSAGLLLAAREVPDLAARFDPDRLLTSVEAIGHAALRSVPTSPDHPARGIPVSRWDRSPRFETGYQMAFTPCDAAFLAGWTWVGLDEVTGDPVWREANETLIDALDRLMTEFPIPPQNYWPDQGAWDVKVIDEAGFGVELFAEQHRLTGDDRMRELGRRYIEQHLAALGREDGLWDREHYLDGRPNKPSIRMTRGLGWPMEGLLAAHRLLPEDGRYLDLASRMAEHLLAAQRPKGFWLHRYEGPAEQWGIGMKGTSLWCWLLYELHRHTGNSAHLAAARRALEWLLDEQYFGEDRNAFGGHVTVSPHSAVGYRPWFPVTCSYGTAFFGLAVLEELRLQSSHANSHDAAGREVGGRLQAGPARSPASPPKAPVEPPAPSPLTTPMPTTVPTPSENLNVLDFWQIYSDRPTALYKSWIGDALNHLRQRKEAVAKLATKSDWSGRQAHMRKVLQELVGPFPEKTPLNARVTSVHQKDGYRIENVIYESQPGLHVTASLYIPDQRQDPSPAILYCSGHSIPGYRGDVYQNNVVNLARKGFIVLAFDPIGQGERLQYFDPETGKSTVGVSSSVGHTYLGGPAFVAGSPLSRHMIWDGIRSVDYLLSRPEVDAARLGITGRSGGGTQTCYISALDDRLLAAAPECYVTTFEYLLLTRGPQDAEQNFRRGIASGLDQPDFLMLRAPKPALIIATTRDIFSYEGTVEAYEEVKRAYDAFGQKDQLRLTTDDAEHESTPRNREAMYAFFQETLGVPGDPMDESVELPTPEELRVTKTGQVSTSLQDKGVPDLLRREADRLTAQLNRQRSDLTAHLPRVKAAAADLSGYRVPDGAGASVYSGTYRKSGYRIDKYLIPVNPHYAVPALILRPEAATNSRVILHLHPEGKAAAATSGGAMERLVQDGYTVVSIDVIGTGELANSRSGYNQWFPGASFKEWHGYLLTGQSIVGAQAGDVMRALRLIRDRLNVPPAKVFAIAHGTLAPVLLHTAALEPAFAGVALVEPLISYREFVTTRFYLPRHVSSAVPSALTAYDLPDLAACLAPRKFLMVNPTDAKGAAALPEVVAEDVSVIRAAYAADAAGFDLREALGPTEVTAALVDWLN